MREFYIQCRFDLSEMCLFIVGDIFFAIIPLLISILKVEILCKTYEISQL